MQLNSRALTGALIFTALCGGLASCGSDDSSGSADTPAGTTAPGQPGDGSAGNGVGSGSGAEPVPQADSADGQAPSDVDEAYVRQMIPHDANVVIMAGEALRESKNSDVQVLARQVRQSQSEELRDLRKFGAEHGYDLSAPDTRMDADAKLMQTTAEKLGTPNVQDASAGEIDKAFVDLLITHHEGSLVMSRAVRAHGTDKTLANLALLRVKALNQELDRLKALKGEL